MRNDIKVTSIGAIGFVNLTDRDLVLEDETGTRHKVPVSLPLNKWNLQTREFPSLDLQTIEAGILEGLFHFEVKRKVSVKNLPEPVSGMIYLVSGHISELANRKDVLTPSFTKAEKDKDGYVIAHRSLVRYTQGSLDEVLKGINRS
jgi:hypothetical protein